MIDRKACLALLFTQSQLYLTQQQFFDSLAGWEVDPVLRPDGSVGIIFLSNGPEFHFAKFGTDIQASRAHLKKYPGELIEKYGYALTRTPKTQVRQRRFNERLGFFLIGEDDFDVFYRIDQLRKKESPCQSSQ